MEYLGNAFSLQMLENPTANVKIRPCSLSEVINKHSIIGHQDLANILGVRMNRVNTKLKELDTLYVAQYIGGRLPEGITELPKDAKIEFFKVTINYMNYEK